MSTTTTFTFPVAEIDPRTKDRKYILQHARAGYNTSKGLMPNSLYFGRLKLAEIRSYAMGAQSIDKYKKLLLPEDSGDETWAAIDWTVLPVLCKFREIAVAKIMQQGIDVQCSAVDPLSKSESDAKFNQMKVKIMLREAAQQAGSEMANSPLLQVNQGEPEDMEQLQIEKEFGFKHVMAMEAELAIAIAHDNNDFAEIDKRVVESLVDYGIGGLTQWIDENGTVREREVDITRLVMSYCVKNDFSDAKYWGEVIEVQLVDLAPYFSPSEMITLCSAAKGKNGNPIDFDYNKPNYIDPFKVYVLDYKFLDYDSIAYEERYDESNNMRFGKTKYGKLNRIDAATEQTSNGQPIYMKSTKKVMRKCKWIIDTDFVYDYGTPDSNFVSENMVRRQSCWWDTGLDLQLYAWNFNKMEFHGLTERLIPLEDEVCKTWYKQQNMANKVVPYIINMDLNALEGLNFGKGGAALKPTEVVDFIFSNYIAPYRSTDLLTRNPNYKPISIESTGQLGLLEQYDRKLLSVIDQMRQVSGLNELTDGSTPNEKTLVPVANAAITSTNNALWPIHNAHKHLMLKASENVVLKQQIAVRLGKVQGLARTLGNDTVQMYSIDPDLSLREIGIVIQDAPTEQERQELWAEVNAKEMQGLVTIADKMLIKSCRNLKMAGMILNYKIQKRQEEQRQFELQKIQENNQGQMQASMQLEQLKQQTAQQQAQLDMQLLIVEKQLDFKIEQMKKTMDLQGESVQADGRLQVGHIAAEAKLIASQIAAEGAKEKQHIANKKPIKKTA